MIRLDPHLTAQALLGLMTNAAEAALAGKAATPIVRLSAHASGEGAAIAVEDNGPGVPADQAAEVFRPFYTTKPEGTGIGLSLARQAIVSQGGQLLLEALAAQWRALPDRLLMRASCPAVEIPPRLSPPDAP